MPALFPLPAQSVWAACSSVSSQTTALLCWVPDPFRVADSACLVSESLVVSMSGRTAQPFCAVSLLHESVSADLGEGLGKRKWKTNLWRRGAEWIVWFGFPLDH